MEGIAMLHVVAGGATVALAIAVALWGLARSRNGGGSSAATARPIAGAFAHVLALAHVAVLATGLLGLMLFSQGDRPHDPLHARVYGPFMVVALVAAWGFRTADDRWNTRVFAVAGLFVAALGVRAFTTG